MKILRGAVIYGDRFGRTLGYRTANLSPRVTAGKNVTRGVYAVRVLISNVWYNGLLVVGVPSKQHPRQRKVEVYVLNFRGNLYGMRIEVHVYKKIRPLVEFPGPSPMRQRIRKDITTARAYFSEKIENPK